MTEEKIVKKALETYGGNPITLEQLATLADWSKKDKKYLGIFSQEWIYLSYEMTRKWFVTGGNKSKVRALYRFYVTKHFDEGTDWKTMDVFGDWISERVEHEFDHEFEVRPSQGGKNAKYYAVSHSCFSAICDKYEKPDLKEHLEKVDLLVELLATYVEESCKVVTSDMAIMRKVSCELETKQMLEKFSYTEITYDQMGEAIGMTEEQVEMLKMFWDPAFNKGWIYLSDDIIKSQMTNEKGKDALIHFYKRVLLQGDYEENVDYKKIEANDELVQKWESFRSPSAASEKKSKKSYRLLISDRKVAKKPHNKAYYAVTGETYKDLLARASTKKGRKTRDYYRKVETLARMMRDYISALHQYLMVKRENELKKQLVASSELVKQKNRKQKLLDAFANHLQGCEPNGWLYIATSAKYSSENYFKVGITTDLKSRLRQYNTERPPTDMMYYVFAHECYEPKQIENKLKFLLKAFNKKNPKKSQKDETYFLGFVKLEMIVKLVCEHHDEEVSVLNDIISTFADNFLEDSVIPEPINIGEPEPETRIVEITETVNDSAGTMVVHRETIDVTTLTVDQKKEKLIQAIEKFAREKKNIEDFNYETSKDSEDQKMVLIWADILQNLMVLCAIEKKNKIKANQWKTQMKTIVRESQCLQRVKWR